MKPVFTVVVPIYNVAKYMERCAISLFEQTFQGEIEYLFVDDASPDCSIEILKSIVERYPDHKRMVKILRHEKNQGLAAARLTGLMSASGDFIIHVDSDDWIDIHFVEKMYAKQQEFNADAVLCDAMYVYPDDCFVMSRRFDSDHTEYIRKLIRGNVPVAIWGIMVRRECALKENALPIPGLNFGEDAATTPRILYYAKTIAYLPEALYYYENSNPSSYSNNITQEIILQQKQVSQVLHAFFQDKERFHEALMTHDMLCRCTLLGQMDHMGCDKTVFLNIIQTFPLVNLRQCRLNRINFFILTTSRIPSLPLWRYGVRLKRLVNRVRYRHKVK